MPFKNLHYNYNGVSILQAMLISFIEKPVLQVETLWTQLSINGVGLTQPLTTSLNPTSKH